MHYSNKPEHVRVELFDARDDNSLGKWRYTIELDMSGMYNSTDRIPAFKECLKRYFLNSDREISGHQGYAICFDPFHKAEYPIHVRIDTHRPTGI